MLSAKRISSWSIAIKSQIVLNLDPKPLASLLSTSFKSDIDQLLTAMPEDRAAKVRIFLKSQPQGHEVEAAELELVRVSRQMLSEGKLNIFDIDPTLALNAA